MSTTLTTAQQAAESRKSQDVVHCIEIGLASPLTYCDGQTVTSTGGTDLHAP